jgi:hypothetical protein
MARPRQDSKENREKRPVANGVSLSQPAGDRPCHPLPPGLFCALFHPNMPILSSLSPIRPVLYQFPMKPTSECSSRLSKGEAKIARDRTLLEKNSPVSHPSSGMRPLKFSPRVPCLESCLKLRPQNDLGHRAAGALPFPTDFNQNKNEETKL